MDYYIGIDFGHGETTVSRVPGYNGELVSQIAIRDGNRQQDKKIISAVCKRNNEWSLVYGSEDFKSPDLREGFKAMITKMKYEDKESMREFAKIVFKTILDNDRDLSYDPNNPDGRNFSLGIACPSDWVKDNHKAPQDYLNFFRHTCNLPIDCCIRESDAAFFTKFFKYKETDNNVLVIDIGSSTIDFTTYANSKCIEECCWGANSGAHLIEDALIDQLKCDSKIMSNISKVNEFRASKGYGDVTSAISLFLRKNKEEYFTEKQRKFSLMLSFADLAPGWPGSPWDVCIGLSKTNDEFEQIISGYKQGIRQVLENAKIKLCQNGIRLTHILLSGGASRMPFIMKYAEDIFGEDIKIDRDQQPECVVSNGIALYAQDMDKALKILLGELNEISYEYIFKTAYAEAKSIAINELLPKYGIPSSNCLTGDNIREEFFNFLKSLNCNNTKYCDLIKTKINLKLSEEVGTAISTAIKKVFNKEISTANVAIDTNPAIYQYTDDCFIFGGAWYTQISKWIEESSSTIFSSLFFDWDETKDASETSRIADGVSYRLKNYSPYGNETFLNLDASIEDLKKQVADLAIRAFYENQLFETTFKQ